MKERHFIDSKGTLEAKQPSFDDLLDHWIEEELKKRPIKDGKECLTDEDITTYVENRSSLSIEDIERIRSHISLCAPCFLDVEDYSLRCPSETEGKGVSRLEQRAKAVFIDNRIDFNDREAQLSLKVSNIVYDIERKEIKNEEDIFLKKNPFILNMKSHLNGVVSMKGITTSEENVQIDADIYANKMIITHTTGLPCELLVDGKTQGGMSDSDQETEPQTVRFNFTLPKGIYYVHPDIVEDKVLSIYIHKLRMQFEEEDEVEDNYADDYMWAEAPLYSSMGGDEDRVVLKCQNLAR